MMGKQSGAGQGPRALEENWQWIICSGRIMKTV